MRKFNSCVALILLLPVLAYAQWDPQRFKKEASSLEGALNGVANAVLPDIPLTQPATATYLEGYGPVFIMGVALERATNPFSSPRPAAEVRQNVERRHKEIKERVSEFLKEKFSELKSAVDSGTLTVVVYLWNTNPDYVPGLPGQIVFTAKKQDAGIAVAVHEYDFGALRR